MKRFTHPILWSLLVSLVLISALTFERRTRAEELTSTQALSDVPVGSKISKDILQKVAEGKGAEFVRVVIQSATQSELSIDSAIEYSGGSDVRKLKNSKVRIATLPVSAAVAMASRSDVAYVSLNRAVQSLGHVTLTTGADQI